MVLTGACRDVGRLGLRETWCSSAVAGQAMAHCVLSFV